MQLNKLNLIAEKAKDKKLKFTSLIHHINAERLKACYAQMNKDRACGVDEITVAAYGKRLDANIADLVERLKTKRYKAQPVRRFYVPKPGKNELRPLGIPSVEDKLVQMAIKQVLDAIYEQDFIESSHGFRKGKGCHSAIKAMHQAIMRQRISYVCEVDIQKFFDTVNHEWLMRFLRERIADENLLWLIKEQLISGVMDDGMLEATSIGTPQGGVISPLLANIYLHYVVDLWMEKRFKSQSKGYVELIRYCDDFVLLCETEVDAKRFIAELGPRLAKFELVISQEKTKMITFGRWPWMQAQMIECEVETFDFLGFTHYCTAGRNGYFCVRHKTNKKNLARKTVEFTAWLRKVRNSTTFKDIWRIIKAKLHGHYNYFGVSGNLMCLRQYYNNVILAVYKWLNRRSQRKSMTSEQYRELLEKNPLPKPSIKYELW
jgi:RNA-directed DNA polymerase